MNSKILQNYRLVLSVAFAILGFKANAFALTLAVYKLEPYVLINEKGDVLGPALDTVKIIGKNLKIPIQVVNVPFARGLASVKSGEYDAILLVAKNKEREDFLRFTKEPLVRDKNAFLVPKDSRFKSAMPLTQFNGLSIGHVIGSVVPEYLNGFKFKWVLVGMEDYFNVNMKRLENHRIDAMFVPTMSHGQWKVKTEFPKAQVRFLPVETSEIHLFLAFNKKFDQKTFDMIDSEVTKKMTSNK